MYNLNTKNKITNTKQSKGITLIALIITIVILLILAVVTIGAVQEDGIIGKAKYARDEYKKAQAKENSILQGYLNQLNDNTLYGNSGSENESDEEVYVNDYGAPIEYSVDLNDDGDLTNDWKVFYKDDTHWYIIASDYLPNRKLPTELNMSIYRTYGAYWESQDDFISENASTITSEVAEKYKLSWLADNSSSADASARATADLLNIEAWTEKFGNAEKGIEAIGAPTLEMWVASWNAKGYTPLYTDSNEGGYFIGTSTTDLTSNYSELLASDTEGFGDKLYFPNTEIVDDCIGYWLASPSVYDQVVTSYRLMHVDCYGDVSNSPFHYRQRHV